MTVSVVLLGLLGSLILTQFLPEYRPGGYWVVPLFFLLLTAVLALIISSKERAKKELTVNYILGIRLMFISLILIFTIIYLLINRAQAMSIAVIAGAFSVLFIFFETKVFLEQNKRHRQ